ncbi:hypothetical protein J8M20_24815, partial [Pseudoalteromonas luteoviolacea]|uniref:hypothetical protein n=1 Tax=Pseudoalteromonas luteoviolacea TaxID=43657 RepID=UPI001B361F41
VFMGLSEESEVEFQSLVNSRNERPLTIAPETKSTLVVIDEAMIKTAIQLIGFEQTTQLMKLIQTHAESTFNQSVLQYVANGILLTIEVGPDMNRVVAIKQVDA